MTPRLPSKRRTKDDGGRPSKKATEERTYDTLEEAMDGGVEMEEKAERWRDGEKAQKYYEQARDLYQKAMQFNDKDFGALYNLARVQLILASQFALPPSNLDLYSSAVSLFHQALSATTNPFQRGEAAFNLAQALASFADVTDELDGTSGSEASREFRQTAVKMLGPVLATQTMWLQGQAQQQAAGEAGAHGAEGAAAASEPSAAPAAAAPVDESMDVEEKADEGERIEVDGEDKAGESSSAAAPSASVSTENAPTPDALVDTVLLLVDLGTTLWDSVTPPQAPPESEQESTREMIEMARNLAPNREGELDLAETKVLLTFDSIMWDIYRDQVQPGMKIERNGEVAVKALQRILQSLDSQSEDDPTLRADILATMANTQLSAAQRYIALAKKFQPAQQYGEGAWRELTAAAGNYNTALKIPVSAATPKEFRPSCYLQLLKNTLSRARLAPINETAARNAQALLDNCAAYGAKASEALGWNFPRLPSSKTGMTPFYSPALDPPHPAGWDMEMLARDVPLTTLRVCFYAMQGEILKEAGTKEMYEMAAQSIVDAVVSVPAGERRLMPADIARFVGDIEDEEGKISPEEDAFWKEVGQGIRKGLDADSSKAAQAIANMFGGE